MQIFVVFGLPGAGKTYVGEVMQMAFDYFMFDGDDELQDEMKEAIQNKSVILDQMRNTFIRNIISRTQKLILVHKKIVIAQTFLQEKHRELFLKHFPQSKFILVQADTKIREFRLQKRTDYPLDPEYAKKMCANFDYPKIPVEVLSNNEDGQESIISQLKLIIPNRQYSPDICQPA
jgi:gluconate kinase